MTKANVTKTINVSADTAWKIIATFRGIENYSPIAKSVTEGEGEGAKRICTMPDGAEINEMLTKLDNQNRYMEYIIVSSPLPLSDYLSKIKVTDVGNNKCEISWGSQFNTEAESSMKPMLEGLYEAIINGLESLINKKPQMA